jgi:hypothetical protein
VALVLLWLVAIVLLPGLVGAWALWRPLGTPSAALAPALVLALGYAISGGVALVLALAHVLSAAAFLTGLMVVVLALIWVTYRGAHGAFPHTWMTLGGWRWPFALGAASLGVIAFSALRIDPALNLAAAARWRYWADGLEIAALGHIPTMSTQWASQYPTTVSKVFLNCFSAGLATLAGSHVLPAYGALYCLSAIGSAAALWALAWELGLRRSAVLLPLLSAASLHLPGGIGLSARFVGPLGVYRAEGIGRIAAFTALALAVRGLRLDNRACLLTSGGLLGVASVSHGVPTLAAVLLGTAYAAAWAIRFGRARTVAKAIATVALPAGVFAAAVLVAAGGDLGFGGATARYVPVDGVDPTALFTGGHRPLRTGGFYLAPSHLVQQLADAAIGVTPPTAIVVLALIVLTAAAAAGLWRLPADLAPLPLTALLFAFLLLATALVFSARSHAYIPGTFGQRRLYDYASLAAVLAALPWLEVLAAQAIRSRRQAAVGIAAVVVLAVAVAFALRPPSVGRKAQRLTASMNAVRANVPCGARVLPDRRTNATFDVLAGRESVLEGMAPYLRPAMLAQVLRQIQAAKLVLSGSPAGRSVLERERVGYVVLLAGRHGVVSHRVDAAALDRLPFLTLTYADRSVTIYRVRGAPPPLDPPPGYDCDAAPLHA